MKYLLLIPVAVLYCLSGKAQKIEINKNKSLDEWQRKKFLSKKLSNIAIDTMKMYTNKQEERQEDPGVLRTQIKANYLGMNNKGDEIYAMTPDNMPCLVPGKSFKSNMPIAGNEKIKESTLPPSIRKVEILPLQQKIIGRGDNTNW